MKSNNRFWIKLLVVFLIFVLTIVLFVFVLFKYKANHATNNSKDLIENEANLGYD